MLSRTSSKLALGLFTASLWIASSASAQMKIDSFNGPVTQNESSSFKAYVTSLTPATDNSHNQWAQGTSGEATKAMGLVYQINGDVGTLDQMIRFCDAVLSERNDLALPPLGQHVIWTGRIDPVWPNVLDQQPITTGGEQGDPVGHLGNCAARILQTPAIWTRTIPSGDLHHYGATYLARAKTYVAEADVAIDGHILKSLLDLSHDDRQYFSAASPYKGGTPVPWNQQMMFNYAFQNLVTAHAILKDDPTRLARYKKIVSTSLDWFFNESQQSYTDKLGNLAYNWGYAMPSKSGEDSNHASLDVAGFYRAFMTNDYALTRSMMTPFANMFVDVMTLGPKSYAGRVDGTTGTGHADATTNVRSGFLFLADFRPDAYLTLVSADLTEGGTTTSPDTFSRFLWIKNKRAHR